MTEKDLWESLPGSPCKFPQNFVYEYSVECIDGGVPVYALLLGLLKILVLLLLLIIRLRITP
jgi:hypothetical protein